MRRTIVPLTLLCLGLALLGGFAWLTRHPESPVLEKAERWAVVGPLASRFRRAYLGPDTTEPTTETEEHLERSPGGATAPPTGVQPTTRQRVGPAASSEAVDRGVRVAAAPPAPSLAVSPTPPVRGETPAPAPVPRPTLSPDPAPSPGGDRPTVTAEQVLYWEWLPPSRTLREGAGQTTVVARTNAISYVPMLARQESWLEVLYRGRRVWVDSEEAPPHPRQGAKPNKLRLETYPEDFVQVRRARKLMGKERSIQTLGPYELLTDVVDAQLLIFLDGAAHSVEGSYFARYGRLPWGKPRGTVILFEREADYREHAKVAELATNVHAGHAGSQVLTLYLEGRPPQELAGTLVHEITHLLNDRALGSHLPEWLEEGLASDLDALWLEDVEGALVRPRNRRLPRPLVTQEVDSSLVKLRELLNRDQLPTLVVLMSLKREWFYKEEILNLTYAHSALFIRFLLDGDAGVWADGFRAFLKAVSVGLEPSTKLLLEELDVDAEKLEAAFRKWLVQMSGAVSNQAKPAA